MVSLFIFMNNNKLTMKRVEHKERVRNNKENMKKTLKLNLPKLNLCSEVSEKKDEADLALLNNLKKHKVSFNYKKFQHLSEYKDKNVQKGFEELFQIHEPLGQGAHSVVHKCLEKETKNIYAVKKTKQHDEELMENIRQCYQIMKQLNHQSILKGKNLYINEKKMVSNLVCEFCDYPDLRTFMVKYQKEKKLMPQKVAAQIINKLVQVLVYLGEKGVCHRDIKPQNILFDPLTHEIKLIDFQLAKMQRYKHEKLQLWTQTGTIDYRAPQYAKKGYGESVDTWAVGIIAYELLTGTLPFPAKSVSMKKKQILEKKLNFDGLFLEGQAKDFLKKILEKNPEERITPKQALSHPFLLKNAVCSFSLKNLNSTFDSEDIDEECQEQRANYYNEDNQFCFLSTLSDDIGVRFQLN